MPLETEVLTVSGVPVLRCSGRIVYGPEVLTLQNQMDGLLFESAKYVLNLSGVGQIDACGVGSLIMGHRAARSLGGSMKLCGIRRRVHELLELMKVAAILQIYPGENDAITAFEPARLAALSFHC